MYPRFFPMLFGKKNLNFLRHISPSRDQFSWWWLDVGGGGEGNGVTNFDPRTRTIFYGKRNVASVSIPYPHADIEIYLCQTFHQLRGLKQKQSKHTCFPYLLYEGANYEAGPPTKNTGKQRLQTEAKKVRSLLFGRG